MANSSVSFTKSTPIDNSLTENQTSENIPDENPPEYDVLYPKSTNDLRIPVKVDQPQSESRCDINSTSTVINSQSRNKIETYTVWSVVNIICCCLPIGFVACYYSMRTKCLRRTGNIQGALEASGKSKTINSIATCLGITMILLNSLRVIIRYSEHKEKSDQTNKYGFH